MDSSRIGKYFLPALVLTIAASSLPASASRTHRSATSGHSHSAKAKKKSASHQLHGQRQIDSSRAREIQTALIREHYLTGEPTGEWDAQSQAAMTRYQADQGWQTKITPDSRALIKLGLGPTQPAAPGNQASSPHVGSSTQNYASPMANSFTGSQSSTQ